MNCSPSPRWFDHVTVRALKHGRGHGHEKGRDVGQTWPPDWQGAVGPPGYPAWPAQPCPCTSCVTKHHETSRHIVRTCHAYSCAYLCALTSSMSVWGTACVNSMEVLRMSSSCGRLTGRLFSAFRNLSGVGGSLLSVLFIWSTLIETWTLF